MLRETGLPGSGIGQADARVILAYQQARREEEQVVCVCVCLDSIPL